MSQIYHEKNGDALCVGKCYAPSQRYAIYRRAKSDGRLRQLVEFGTFASSKEAQAALDKYAKVRNLPAQKTRDLWIHTREITVAGKRYRRYGEQMVIGVKESETAGWRQHHVAADLDELMTEWKYLYDRSEEAK
jgi:hypothetical protein